MMRILTAPLHLLRRHALAYWAVVLAFLIAAPAAWVLALQPTYGRPFGPEDWAFMLLIVFGLGWLVFSGWSEAEARQVGTRLAASRITGVFITLTLIVVLFWAGEAFLRRFYITTDGFGFTAMNYHWYQNFGLANLNSLGYRDDEPNPDAAQRVAVLGDSFAMGHGIADRESLFAKRLEVALNPDGGDAAVDVNLIARSGWDSDIHMYNLDQYPYRPNVVVLSYYLNDIDYLLAAPETNPDNRFTFPDNPLLAGFIRDFFVPNFIYYNLLQFTSSARTGGHTQALVDAHMDDALWSQQAQRLYELTLWARDHDAALVVVLWPHLSQTAESQPAIARVAAFFAEQGVETVDMTRLIEPLAVRERIVNAFDTHPSAEANRLAADALLPLVQNRLASTPSAR
jgi:hypothetical protein